MPVNIRFSYGRQDKFRFMIVRLSGSGVVGWGESLTNPDEKLKDILPELIGKDAGQLDGLLTGNWQDLETIILEPFSMALHNLVCNARDITLPTLVSAQNRTSVPLMPCMFPNTVEQAEQFAEKWIELGFKHLKTKLLGQREHDVAIVKAIRRAIGQDCYLQGDANMGYKDLPTARDVLKELYESGLNCIEDPLDSSLADIARLRKWVPIPIMLDQAARSLPDIAEIGRLGAADIINLHPCQQGTVSELTARDNLARSLGMKVIIGGTGFAGPGTAFYQQLASIFGLDGPCGEIGGARDHGMPENLLSSDNHIRTTIEFPQTDANIAAVDIEKVKQYATSSISF